MYGSLLPFNYIASGFYITNFLSHLNKQDAKNLAGIYMSAPFVISAVLIPILGIRFLIKKVSLLIKWEEGLSSHSSHLYSDFASLIIYFILIHYYLFS